MYNIRIKCNNYIILSRVTLECGVVDGQRGLAIYNILYYYGQKKKTKWRDVNRI